MQSYFMRNSFFPFSVWFIHNFYKDSSYQPLKGFLPSFSVLGALALAYCTTAFSEVRYLNDQSKAPISHQINRFRIKFKFLYKQGTSYILHVCYCIRFTIENVLLEQCENENGKIKLKTFSLNSMPCSFGISATEEIIYTCRNIEWNSTFWTFQINISNSSFYYATVNNAMKSSVWIYLFLYYRHNKLFLFLWNQGWNNGHKSDTRYKLT